MAQRLERVPLDPELRADRAWAMQWLIDTPEISVTGCLDPLGGISVTDFDYSSDIIAQYTLSMAAFVIRHPDLENDVEAQQIAGVESALKAYKAIRDAKASAKSPPLEKLLDVQRRGELSDAIRKAYLQCSGNPPSKMLPVNAPTAAAEWEQIWDQPGVAIFYADKNSMAATNGIRSLTTRAQYREPFPEGFISERIRVEEFDCRQHRSRALRSVVLGIDGRAPQAVDFTAKESVWRVTEAGSLGRAKEDFACAAISK